MKPAITLLIFAIAAVPTAGFIAALLGLMGAPILVQLGLVVLSLLVAMLAAAGVWSLKSEAS